MAFNHQPPPTGLASYRFPVEPWRFVETDYSTDDLGHTETLFGVGNGYLGMRANPEEGRDAHTHGTYVNGFHETWEIQHAETAFGFAKVGQTIVNVPDAKLIKLYVDDEPLLLSTADLEHYERSIDFRAGFLVRDLLWRTPGGKRVRVRSTRMVLDGRTPSRRDDLRGHAARQRVRPSSSRRSCSTVRTGRTSTTSPMLRSARHTTSGTRARPASSNSGCWFRHLRTTTRPGATATSSSDTRAPTAA